MDRYIDMHSHLDFADRYTEIAKDARTMGISSICSTVTPSSFIAARSALSDIGSMHVSLGLHPWWVGDGRVSEVDINRFENLLSETRFIGEIGLDLHVRHEGSLKRQLDVLERALLAIEDAHHGFLITLHCVKSAGLVLDKLEEHDIFRNNDILFHWFSGTEDDLARACSKGCFFSVGMKMLATRSGRRFACAIPEEQLLLESDLPTHEGAPWSAELWRENLDGALENLSDMRSLEPNVLSDILFSNSSGLISKYSELG